MKRRGMNQAIDSAAILADALLQSDGNVTIMDPKGELQEIMHGLGEQESKELIENLHEVKKARALSQSGYVLPFLVHQTRRTTHNGYSEIPDFVKDPVFRHDPKQSLQDYFKENN